jgi:hypothetical protein
MARYKGKDGSVTVGGTEVSQRVSFELELSTEELDANEQGSDWTDVESGQSSASLSLEVNYDPASHTFAPGDEIAVVLYPAGDSTGLSSFTGTFMVTSVGIPSGVGDLVKNTIQARNKGAVVRATVSS